MFIIGVFMDSLASVRAMAFAGALGLSLLSACGGDSPASPPLAGYTLPDSADFSDQTDWVAAFDDAHRKFSAEYALTEWKGVDWNDLYRRHVEAIRVAAATGSVQAYFVALHQYLFDIDDGHVSMPITPSNADLVNGLIRQQSGGGYGLGLAELDDGTVIAARVSPGGPGAIAGIQPGARIVRWGSRDVAAAIDAVDPGSLAAATHMATRIHQRLEQVRLLTRAPVDTTVEVVYRNPGETGTRTTILRAVDDALAGLHLLDFAPAPSAADEAAIVWSSARDGYRFIRLTALAHLDDVARSPEDIWTKIQAAVAQANNEGSPAIVLDIRGNHGGYDALAAMVCGLFTSAPTFYEIIEMFDKRTGNFVNLSTDFETGELADRSMITPRKPQYTGKVVALVNPRTLSSGEGLARCVRDNPNGAVVGFHGTRGSFAAAGGEIVMPGGITLHYPYGRAVDADRSVLIDSRNGVGGVLPTVPVARTQANVLAYANGEDPEFRAAVAYLDRLLGRSDH